MILSMKTTIQIPSDMTVADLIEILEMVPDKSAVVRGGHYSGGYGSSDSYRLDITWTKEVQR